MATLVNPVRSGLQTRRSASLQVYSPTLHAGVLHLAPPASQKLAAAQVCTRDHPVRSALQIWRSAPEHRY